MEKVNGIKLLCSTLFGISASILLHCLALFALSESEEDLGPRKRRGFFRSTYPPESNNLQIGGIDVDYFGKSEDIPLQPTEGAGKSLSTSQFVELDTYNQRFHDPELYHIPQVAYASSNAIDRPVQEPQEFVPSLPMGTVIIPRLPPPATPVNAAAFNVPANGGAVFLGSGSLGVLDLGGGAYALGSGAIGYSERRSNPRSSFRAPLLPPVQAAPNLIPAAVNSPLPLQQTPIVEYQFPVTGQQLPTDQNGYEYLPPNRVGFGDPSPPRPLKTRNVFATPTALQLPPPPVYPPLDPSKSFQLPQPAQPSQHFQRPQLLQQSVTPRGVDYTRFYGQVVTESISSSYQK